MTSNTFDLSYCSLAPLWNFHAVYAIESFICSVGWAIDRFHSHSQQASEQNTNCYCMNKKWAFDTQKKKLNRIRIAMLLFWTTEMDPTTHRLVVACVLFFLSPSFEEKSYHLTKKRSIKATRMKYATNNKMNRTFTLQIGSE